LAKSQGGVFHTIEAAFPTSVLASNFAFPMVGDETPRTGMLKYGIRMRIKPSVDVAAKLQAAGYTGDRLSQNIMVAKALQSYGVYAGETSGNGSRIKLEALQREAALSGTTGILFGANRGDFSAFQSALQRDLTEVRMYGGSGVNWGSAPAGAERLILDTKALATTANISAARTYIQGLARRPVFTFCAEPEDQYGSGTSGVGSTGTYADYISRHRAWYNALNDIADIGWNLMAQTFRNSTYWGSADDFYPGDAYVDEIAVDSYAKPSSLPYPTPEYMFGNTRDYAALHGKPWSVYETGLRTNITSTQANRVAWLSDFNTWLQTLANRPKRYLYFEASNAGNDYNIEAEPDTLAAFRTLYDNNYLSNTSSGTRTYDWKVYQADLKVFPFATDWEVISENYDPPSTTTPDPTPTLTTSVVRTTHGVAAIVEVDPSGDPFGIFSTRAAIAKPSGATVLTAPMTSAQIQAVIDAKPAGTTFWFDGHFTGLTARINVRDSDKFLTNNARLSGSTVYTVGDRYTAGSTKSGPDYCFDPSTGGQDRKNVTIRGFEIDNFSISAIRPGLGGYISHILAHDNFRNGIGAGMDRTAGWFPQCTVEDCIVWDNGSVDELGSGSGGIKFAATGDGTDIDHGGVVAAATPGSGVVLRRIYTYRNIGNGLWTDVASGGDLWEQIVADENTRKGIHYEIGVGPSTIQDSTSKNNGTWLYESPRTSSDWGIVVMNSLNVTVQRCLLINNADDNGVKIDQDNRAGTGHGTDNITVANINLQDTQVYFKTADVTGTVTESNIGNLGSLYGASYTGSFNPNVTDPPPSGGGVKKELKYAIRSELVSETASSGGGGSTGGSGGDTTTSSSGAGTSGLYRVTDSPLEGVRMEYGGPITQKFLETIEHNNNLINQLAIDADVFNVNGNMTRSGENKPRKGKHKRFLERDVAIWADVAKFNFGGAVYVGDTAGKPSWKGFRYDFPNNANGDFFSDAHLPVVVCQMYNTPGLTFPKLTLSLTRIATNFFKFDIYQLESGSFISGSDDLYISVLAIGRRGDYWPDLQEALQTPNNIIPL
jgi:hypothetical protein